MKNLVKVGIVLVVVVAILGMAKVTVLANEKAISEVEDTGVIIQEDTRINEETAGGETFTYRLVVDKIDYLSFRKGHDGEYTLVYSINGGKEQTVVMGMIAVEMFNAQPRYISHYYDIMDVKEGDVIEYTYSYYNTYLQDGAPNVVEGSQVVEAPASPEEN